jgi:hypothetical protein
MKAVPPTNMYEELQAYFCFALASMARDDVEERIFVRSSAHLVEVVQNTYQEVSEILTNIFDFMYFYQREPSVYIPAIWGSWDVIPNIMSRVDEYLVRTLTAVLIDNLQAEDPYKATMEVVQGELEKLLKKFPDTNIIERALSTLTNERQRFREEMMKVIYLAALSNAFLYAPAVASIMNRGFAQAGKGQEHKANVFEPGHVVGNALKFMFDQSQSALTNEPDFKKSAWMMAQLAFAHPGDDA